MALTRPPQAIGIPVSACKYVLVSRAQKFTLSIKEGGKPKNGQNPVIVFDRLVFHKRFILDRIGAASFDGSDTYIT